MAQQGRNQGIQSLTLEALSRLRLVALAAPLALLFVVATRGILLQKFPLKMEVVETTVALRAQRRLVMDESCSH